MTVRNGNLSHKDRCHLGTLAGQATTALPNAAYVVGVLTTVLELVLLLV